MSDAEKAVESAYNTLQACRSTLVDHVSLQNRFDELEQDKADLELAFHTSISNFKDEISGLKKDKAEIEEKYQELVVTVERKFMGESRHETALRYIKEAEAYKSESAGIARMEGEE